VLNDLACTATIAVWVRIRFALDPSHAQDDSIMRRENCLAGQQVQRPDAGPKVTRPTHVLP